MRAYELATSAKGNESPASALVLLFDPPPVPQRLMSAQNCQGARCVSGARRGGIVMAPDLLEVEFAVAVAVTKDERLLDRSRLKTEGAHRERQLVEVDRAWERRARASE